MGKISIEDKILFKNLRKKTGKNKMWKKFLLNNDGHHIKHLVIQ